MEFALYALLALTAAAGAARAGGLRPASSLDRFGVTIPLGIVLSCALGVQALSAAPADVRFATVDGRNVAYQVSGSGRPAIVMLAGLGNGMESFAGVAPELAKFATVIVYDRPGYGQSSPSETTEAKSAARDLSAVLAHSGVPGPYILVGHSLGGLYAEYFAAEHPKQVAGLVLEESRPADFTERCEAEHLSMCAPTPSMVQAMAKGVRAEVAGLAQTVSEVEAAGRVRREPVLVISRPIGGNAPPFDQLWARAQVDLAASYGAPHAIAPAGGHYIHIEQRDWFVAEVRDFVANARPRR